MPVIVASPAYPRPPLDGDKLRFTALLLELARLEPLRGVFGFMPWLGEKRELDFDRLFASIDILATPRLEVTARAAVLALRGRPSAFGRRATPAWRRAVEATASRLSADPLLLLGTSAGFISPVGQRSVLDLLDVRSRVRTLSGDRITSTAALRLELSLARRHQVLLACEADRDWLIDKGAAAERIHIVPHGVDPAFFERLQPESPPVILFTGSLHYRPNRVAIEWFLARCWPALSGRSVRLRIVGYGADRIKPGPGIEIFSDVPDVLPHYRAATLAIAPLLEARGTQFKVLEAMAAGLPVVCTSPVERGLFSPNPAISADDPSAFSRACERLLDGAAERADLGRRGVAYVRAHHSWPASAAILRQLLLA